MAKQKETSIEVVTTSTQVSEKSAKVEEKLSGADVVHVVSCLENKRQYTLKSTDEPVTIPSYLHEVGKKQIIRPDGQSVFFTLKRQVWEELLALYGNTDVFVNGLIFECSQDQYEDGDTQKELAKKKTGYEAVPPKNGTATQEVKA